MGVEGDAMNWHWPQWTIAALYVLALFGNVVTHGKLRTGNNNGVIGIIAMMFYSWVLYCGGFWTP